MIDSSLMNHSATLRKENFSTLSPSTAKVLLGNFPKLRYSPINQARCESYSDDRMRY